MQYSVVIIIPGYNKEEAANTKKWRDDGEWLWCCGEETTTI